MPRLPSTPLTSFSFVTIVGYLMVAAFVVLADRIGGDPGLGWHLKTGEWILANHAIPRVDPFLWNFEHAGWICNQWLSDVLFFSIYSAYSWLGVHLFAFFIGFSAYFFVLGSSALDERVPAVPQNIAFALAVLCGSLHWITRPVVFSLLGFAVLDALIRSHRKSQRSNSSFLCSVALLFVVWANLHPAFVLGVLLLILYAASSYVESHRSLSRASIPALAVLVSFLASLVNPYGFDLHRAAIELGRSDFFMNLNTEWLAPTPRGAQFLPLYVALFFGLIGSFRVHGSLFDSLKALCFAALALNGARFIPFFGIAALPAMASAIQSTMVLIRLERFVPLKLCSMHRILFRVVPGLAICVAILLVRPHDEAALGLSPHFPMIAIHAAFDDANSAQQLPVLHTPDWGGAITWSYYPQRLAWIDDRNELNGEQKYRDFIAIENGSAEWKSKLADGGFRRVLTRSTSPLAQLLKESPEWHNIFADKTAVVFEKNRVDARQ